MMPSNLANFKSWYVDVLESLYHNRSAGFILMMIAFPLIERYFRQKLGLSEDDILPTGCHFYKELYTLFPQLGSVDKAEKFWRVHRNGFLHQTTFSAKIKPSPPSALTHDIPDTIVDDPIFGVIVHPVKFVERIIKTILEDFSTYEGRTSSPSLPVIRQLATETGGNIIGTISTSAGTGGIMDSKGRIR
jgi:hypothetical protein